MTLENDNLSNLLALRQEILNLSQYHFDSLSCFHLGNRITADGSKIDIFGFTNSPPSPPSVPPEKSNHYVSPASTATCIRSLLIYPKIKTNFDFSPLRQKLIDLHGTNSLTTSGLMSGNPFTSAMVLPLLKDIKAPIESKLVKDCIDNVEKALREDGVAIEKDQDDRRLPHSYLTYLALRGLEIWKDEIGDIKATAAPSLNWSRLEFLRQISLFSSHHEESDVYQLGYSLLIQYKFYKEDYGDVIIDLGLKTLFDAQLERGIWEKKDAVFKYGEFGDFYCFSFELLSALMCEFESSPELLLKYDDHLLKALRWIERNKKLTWENKLIKGDAPAWRFGSWGIANKPESWATAEVYSFLRYYEKYISSRIQDAVLKSFRTTLNSKLNPEAFAPMYHPEVRLDSESKSIQLDELLKKRLLEPLAGPGRSSSAYSLVNNSQPKQRNRSGILFGPPGTGKTSYVKAIAQYLGWPLIRLDPSDFAKEGMAFIPSVTTRLFEQLLLLEDVVIFFDEMEELMRTRDSKNQDSVQAGSFEQRFLTTTFLPKLQDLADQASCLFFVATNYYETIDEAARRQGRFDFTIQILPPSLIEKERLVNEQWRQRKGEDAPGEVHDELKRAEQKWQKLTWATRTEMLTLIDMLVSSEVGKARDIIEAFSPNLSGEARVKVDKETKYNVFGLRE